MQAISQASDEFLAAEAGGGSQAAFEELVRRYERRVYSFLRRRCRSLHDLEDLTQNTFVEAWRSIARYSPKWRFSTWLFTIATRQLTAMLRRGSVHARAMHAIGQAGEMERCGPQDDASTDAAESEEKSNLWRVVEETLDPVQQTVLWLRYAESFSILEIARIIDRPAVTTRVILFRARQALRAAVESGSVPATVPALHEASNA